jgi:hypothetical protein
VHRGELRGDALNCALMFRSGRAGNPGCGELRRGSARQHESSCRDCDNGTSHHAPTADGNGAAPLAAPNPPASSEWGADSRGALTSPSFSLNRANRTDQMRAEPADFVN